MRGWLRGLVVVVALATPGFALAQAAPEPKVVRPGVAGVCTDRHQATIDEAYRVAAERTRVALAALAANPEHPNLRRWFGDTPAKVVETRLRLILGGLERGRPHDTACEQPRACQGPIAAYAVPMSGALGFCVRFFRMPDAGFDSRFGTVIHEVSHLVADTEDFAYGPRRVEALARENPGLAARNADSYQYFVETIGR